MRTCWYDEYLDRFFINFLHDEVKDQFLCVWSCLSSGIIDDTNGWLAQNNSIVLSWDYWQNTNGWLTQKNSVGLSTKFFLFSSYPTFPTYTIWQSWNQSLRCSLIQLLVSYFFQRLGTSIIGVTWSYRFSMYMKFAQSTWPFIYLFIFFTFGSFCVEHGY